MSDPKREHERWCASVPRGNDVVMGRGPYPCDCGVVKREGVPVEEADTKQWQEWRSKLVEAWANGCRNIHLTQIKGSSSLLVVTG